MGEKRDWMHVSQVVPGLGDIRAWQVNQVTEAEGTPQ